MAKLSSAMPDRVAMMWPSTTTPPVQYAGAAPGARAMRRSRMNLGQSGESYMRSSLPGEEGVQSSQSRPEFMCSRWRIEIARLRSSMFA
jgi:hypothetical protein